jgi:hypothetical protein
MTTDRSKARVTHSERLAPAASGLTAVEVDGCVSVFNAATQRAVMLNETATDVWRLVDGTRDAEAIVQSVAEHYGLDPATIRADVVGAIDVLRREALLAEPSAAASEPGT